MPLDFLRREDIADAQGIDIWTDAVPDGPRSDGTVEGVAAARSAWERSRASLRFRACTTADGRELVAFDPAHAPVFEDEAAYLDRHGLLTAHERRALGLSG
jgi:hypothetical protein